MATSTFSGPIKAGDIFYTTGTTVGTNVANVGYVTMAQSSAVDIIGFDRRLVVRVALAASPPFAHPSSGELDQPADDRSVLASATAASASASGRADAGGRAARASEPSAMRAFLPVPLRRQHLRKQPYQPYWPGAVDPEAAGMPSDQEKPFHLPRISG